MTCLHSQVRFMQQTGCDMMDAETGGEAGRGEVG